jgi:hypothetical protein
MLRNIVISVFWRIVVSAAVAERGLGPRSCSGSRGSSINREGVRLIAPRHDLIQVDKDRLVGRSEPGSYAQAEGSTQRRAPVKAEERTIRIGTLGDVLTILVRHTDVIEPFTIFLPEST